MPKGEIRADTEDQEVIEQEMINDPSSTYL